jgi:peptidyl-prolyl cis-trans isomerase C
VKTLGLCLGATLVLAANACHRQSPGNVVARVGGAPITATDLALAAQRYGWAASAGAADRKKAVLDKLIDFQVVVREGYRRGYDKDPQIVALLEQHLFARVLHDEIDAKLAPTSVSNEDVARYYTEHIAEFGRPDETRISQIVVKDEALARRLANEARTARRKNDATADLQGFRALVARYSQHEASKGRAGDLGFVARDSRAHPPAVVQGAFALTEDGQISDGIRAEDGFHILKRTGFRPSTLRLLDQARPLIQQILVRERRSRATEELTAKLRRELRVEIDDQNLARASLDRRADGGAR